VIAVAHVYEAFLVTASGGDVSSGGFETCENLLSNLHGRSHDRHFWPSSRVSKHSFDQESVSVIDYARAHHHDVNVKR
jgi:hypothetical protein